LPQQAISIYVKKIQIGSQEAQVGEVDELCCALADEVEALIQSRAEAGKFRRSRACDG
jgi:hypothetical protein